MSSNVASIASPMKSRKQFWAKRRHSLFGNTRDSAEEVAPQLKKTSLWSPIKTKSTLSLHLPSNNDASQSKADKQPRRFFRRSSLGHVPQRVPNLTVGDNSTTSRNTLPSQTSPRKAPRKVNGTRSDDGLRRGKSPLRTNSGRSLKSVKSLARKVTNSGQTITLSPGRESPSARTSAGQSVASLQGKSPVRTNSSPSAASRGKSPIRRGLPRRNLSAPRLEGTSGPPKNRPAMHGKQPSLQSLPLKQQQPRQKGKSSVQSVSSVRSRDVSGRIRTPKSPMRKRVENKSPRPLKNQSPLTPASPIKPYQTLMRSNPQTPLRKMKPLPPQESPDSSVGSARASLTLKPAPVPCLSPRGGASVNGMTSPRSIRSAGCRRATLTHVSPQAVTSPQAVATRVSARPINNSLSPVGTQSPKPRVQPGRTPRTPGRGFRRATMNHISPQRDNSHRPEQSDASATTLSTPRPAEQKRLQQQQRTPQLSTGSSRRSTMSHVPFVDDDDDDNNTSFQPMSQPMSPQRPAKSSTVGMSSPVANQKVPFSQLAGCPMTPAVNHSPMKRPGKVVIARSDGLFLQVEDAPVEVSRNTRLYEYARESNWEGVAEECRLFPRDAKCVNDVDGTTALHLAVMSRCNPLLDNDQVQPAPIHVIEQLVLACPEAAITRCLAKKYTPLTYACVVMHRGYDMEESAKVVSILLRHAPQSVYVFTDDGFSALDVHILSYSRFHPEREGTGYAYQPSTTVLQTLLQEKPDLAEARSYNNRVRGPVELLYRSNLKEFKVLGSSVMESDWWAWKWVSLLLKYAPNSSGELPKPDAPFSALHAAVGLVGCPLPVISLAASAFPSQLSEPDPRGELGNLPLHEVCSWVCDQETINGDPFVLRRKAMAIEFLLRECPQAASVQNKMSETPLQLAIESRTPWEAGLKLLIEASPDALEIPRKLRECDDDNELLLSAEVYDDHQSVDSDWVDPLEAVEGMFPFMVAAVVAHIPDNKLKGPSYFAEKQSAEEHALDIAKKGLESVRSIYGLLRRKPGLLGTYKPVSRERPERDADITNTEYSECSDYTEVTVDE